MTAALCFWLAFSITVALLATALVTGRRGRRRVHLWVGPLAMVSLAITVWFAEQLVSHYRFPERPMAIHLLCAKTAGLLALPVIVTGVLLVRNPAVRPWHRLAVTLFVLATLVATGTGIWIFTQAVPR